jgi:tRNA threonylcarbamoyladenosine biosynthesis protein TsaB
MNFQYNEIENPPDPSQKRVIMALDTASPVVSVAVGIDTTVVTEQSLELKESSSRLMSLIDATLQQANLRLESIDTLLGLRGPGSFTGLRVGLATLQGLAQSLGARVGTLSSLEVLAELGRASEGNPIVACVDALRGEWLVQTFSEGQSIDEPHLVRGQDLGASGPCQLIGYGISTIRDQIDFLSDLSFTEPGPLAGRAIEMFDEARVMWGFEGLRNPLYQRPPATIAPGR